MSDVYGQKGYCHDHGKYRPCSKCQDVLIDIGIQIDKDRIRELEAMATWQPIESAPVCGEVILLCMPKIGAMRDSSVRRVYEGLWNESQCTFTSVNGFILLTGATHWMPLPPPPEGE